METKQEEHRLRSTVRYNTIYGIWVVCSCSVVVRLTEVNVQCEHGEPSYVDEGASRTTTTQNNKNMLIHKATDRSTDIWKKRRPPYDGSEDRTAHECQQSPNNTYSTFIALLKTTKWL
eukprot:scaffold2257_cov169-Amphora_coffeaeformis.AAC.11